LKYYFGSLAMCFFALFSKESSLMLPLVIVLFDQVFVASRLNFKQRAVYYFGFAPIILFFLYLYFVVFPNASLFSHWLGGSFVNHCLIMGYIWFFYLTSVLFPWTVKLIPGLYNPPVPGGVLILTIGSFFIIFMISVLALWRQSKEAFFFLFWFIIFYLPVSNLLPIANPMAYRFMYWSCDSFSVLFKKSFQ